MFDGRKSIAHLGPELQNLRRQRVDTDLERPDAIGQALQRLDGFFEHFNASGECGDVHFDGPRRSTS
jgi:hypothetical protein